MISRALLRLAILLLAGSWAPAASSAVSPQAAGDDRRCLADQGSLAARSQACTRLLEGSGEAPLNKARYLAARGRIRLQQKDYVGADADLTAAISTGFASAETYFDRALARTDDKQPTLAIVDYASVLRLDPKDASALYNRALLFDDAGDHKRALGDLEQARKLAPTDVDTVVQLGMEYGQFDRTQDELDCYAAALALQPHAYLALVNRGEVFIKLKNWPAAAKAVDTGLAAYPKDAAMHDDRGWVAQEMGDEKLARAEYDRAVAADRTYVPGLKDRAGLESRAGDYRSAVKDYRAVAKLETGDAGAADDLVTALIGAGDAKSAVDVADAALAAAPNDVSLLVDRGRAFWNESDYARAIADYDRALEAHPTELSALFDRALVFRAQGHYDRAIRDLDAGLRSTPGDADSLEVKGEVYADLNDYLSAIESFNAAILADPKRLSAYRSRADAERNIGEVAAAAADDAVAKRREGPPATVR